MQTVEKKAEPETDWPDEPPTVTTSLPTLQILATTSGSSQLYGYRDSVGTRLEGREHEERGTSLSHAAPILSGATCEGKIRVHDG